MSEVVDFATFASNKSRGAVVLRPILPCMPARVVQTEEARILRDREYYRANSTLMVEVWRRAAKLSQRLFSEIQIDPRAAGVVRIRIACMGWPLELIVNQLLDLDAQWDTNGEYYAAIYLAWQERHRKLIELSVPASKDRPGRSVPRLIWENA